VPVTDLQGNYEGYILKYDWSRKHIIRTALLSLNILYNNETLTGQWKEEDGVIIQLHASLSGNALVFKNMHYHLTDHYNPDTPVLWNFDHARLQLLRAGDSVYLAGNLYLFSPGSKEPAKPLYVVLNRAQPNEQKQSSAVLPKAATEKTSIEAVSLLQAIPNPFENSFMLRFVLLKACEVQVQLINQSGQVVYIKSMQKLSAGKQNLPVQIGNLPAGAYTVKLYCGEQAGSILVIKQ
jgi:hypothetical protein